MASSSGLTLPNLSSVVQLTPDEVQRAYGPPKPNLFASGVQAGLKEAQGTAASTVSAVGQLTGNDYLRRQGQYLADESAAEAQQVGRPDLEGSVLAGGLGEFLPRLGYQVSKAVPTIAATIAGTALVPEAAVPAGLTRLGATLPRALGGAGLSGAAATSEAGAAIGTQFGKAAIAGTVAQYPQVAGAMYQQAVERGDASPNDAAAALLLGGPVAAVSSLQPAGAAGLIARGAEGNLVARVAGAGAANAAAGLIQGGLSEAANQSFRSDRTAVDKMKSIVDAALSSAVVGGAIGGALGIHKASPIEIPGLTDTAPSPTPIAGLLPPPSIRVPPGGLQGPPLLAAPEIAGLLPAPSDANRPPLRNPVRLPGQPLPGEDLGGLIPAEQRFTPPTADTPTADQRPGADIQSDLFEPAGPPPAGPIARTPEAYGEVETALSATKGKPTGDLLAHGQELGLLTETGRRRNIDNELAQTARSITAVETKIQSAAAKNNQGLYKKLVAEQKALTKKRDALDEIRQLRAASDALREESDRVSAESEVATPANVPEPQKNVFVQLGEALQAHDDLRRAGASEQAIADARTKVQEIEAELNPRGTGLFSNNAKSINQIRREYNSAVQEAEDVAPHRTEGPAPTDIYDAPDQAQKISAEMFGPSKDANAPELQMREATLARQVPSAPTPRAAPIVDPRTGLRKRPDGVPEIDVDAAYLQARADQHVANGRAPGGSRPIGQVAPRKTSTAAQAQDFLNYRQAQQGLTVISKPETPSPRVRSTTERLQPRQQVDTNDPLAFDAHVTRIADALGPAVRDRVHIVDTVGDLPGEIRLGVILQGHKPNSIDGIHTKDGVYVVRENVRSVEDLQAILAHEIIGHDGAQLLHGSQYNHVMTDIFNRAGGADGLLELADKFKTRRYFEQYVGKNISDAKLVDEFMAFAAEKQDLEPSVRNTLKAWAGDLQRAAVAFFNKIGLKSFADRLLKFNEFEAVSLLRDMRRAVAEDVGPGGATDREVRYRSTVKGANDTVELGTRYAEAALDAFSNIKDSAHKLTLGWQTLTGLARQWERSLPQIQELVSARHNRDVIRHRFNELYDGVVRAADAFARGDKKAGLALQNVMRGSQFGFDYRKTWGEHTHLHDEPNARQLAKEFAAGQVEYNKLKQKGGAEIYDRMVALSEGDNYARLAQTLQGLIQDQYAGLNIPGFAQSPGEVFQQASELHGDPLASREFWKNSLDQRLEAARKYVAEQRGEVARLDPGPLGKGASDEAKKRQAEVRDLRERITPLVALVNDIDEALKRQTEAPYFHLGRSGDYVVSMHLPVTPDGKIDAKAMDRVAERLAKNEFGDLALSEASTKAHIFASVENPARMDALYRLASELQDEGLLDQTKEISRGPRQEPNLLEKMSPIWLQKLLKSMEAIGESETDSPEVRAARDKVRNELKAAWLDMLPTHSMSRVLARRQGVQGYSTAMLRNFAFRGQVTANALGNLSTAPKINSIYGSLRDAALQARKDRTVSSDHVLGVNRVVEELIRREADRPWRAQNDLVTTLRSLNHSYYLGLSPAYMLMQVSQVPLIAWPELSRSTGNGFAATAKALVGSTGQAFKIMAAVAKGENAVDGIITKQALAKAGIGQETADFVLGLVNRGILDLGGFSRELGRAANAADGRLDNALRWANATSVYSEAFSRLQVALAARKLYKGDPAKLNDVIARTVNEAMFTWGTWNNSRQTGRQGLLGPVSPIAFAFTGYQTQMIEKMYKEIGTAFFDKAASAEERTAARRFLGGHLAAVVGVAGSLGLPAAGWFSGAATKLSGIVTDGEGYDVEAAWRNFLSDMFGEKFGEVLSRGVPRALGVDLSRLGDQDLLPFSQLMRNRQSFKDALPDWAADMTGAPTSMLSNWIVGGQMMASGQVMQGMQQLAPRAIKNVIEGYRMTNEGYTNTKGQKLPLEPGAWDIMQKMMGFTPAQRAEYSEAARVQAGQRGSVAARAGRIRQSLASAIESGDQETAKTWLAEARKFDQAHPTQSILPSLPGLLQRRMTARQQAQATGTPLGVDIRDPNLVGLSRFANF